MTATAVKPAYQATIGQYTAASDARQGDRQLLSLVVELDCDGAGGRCRVELGGANFAPVEASDPVGVKLDVGGGMIAVFTGATYASEATSASELVAAADGVAKLAAKQVEGTYETTSAGAVIKDLIQQAGAKAGTVADGPSLPSYAVHAGPSALAHVRRLAELAGADIYTDGAGKVHVAAPRQGSEDHSFKFGETILALDLRRLPLAFDGVELWGEGAAAAEGEDKAYWLSTDLSGLKAEAAVGASGEAEAGSSGTSARRIGSGAIRSADAAKGAAKAIAAARASRLVQGSMEVFGAPAVLPGDLVAITGLPADHAATKLLAGRTLRVRGVRHTLSRQSGLRTRLEF